MQGRWSWAAGDGAKPIGCPASRDELVTTALAVLAEEPDADGGLQLVVTFPDARHAGWALWQLATDAEVLAPPSLRTSLHDRAPAIAVAYGDAPSVPRRW